MSPQPSDELIPSAAILAEYENLVPGSAQHLLTLVEQEATHRRNVELRELEAQIKDGIAARHEARLGQVFAFLIGIVAIAAGTYTATHGAELSGGFIGGGGVIGLVTVFILGRRDVSRAK